MFSVTAARGVRYAHINQSECSAQVVQCGGPDAALRGGIKQMWVQTLDTHWSSVKPGGHPAAATF